MAVSESIRVSVDPTGEMAALLRKARASVRPMIVEAGDASYIVHVDNRTLASVDPHATEEEKRALWANFGPERSRAILREVEGSLADVDADQFIVDVYRWREEGSRPMNHPKMHGVVDAGWGGGRPRPQPGAGIRAKRCRERPCSRRVSSPLLPRGRYTR